MMNPEQQQMSQEDMELLAAAEELYEICKEAGIDVNALTDAEIFKLAEEAAAAAASTEESEEKKEEKSEEKPAEENKEGGATDFDDLKFAEAELMGRIMARTMMDELSKIAASIQEQELQFQKTAELLTQQQQPVDMSKVAGLLGAVELWAAAKYGQQNQ